MPDVSLLATLVAAVLGVALGGLWYGPFFGRAWLHARGRSSVEVPRRGGLKAYAVTFALGLVASYVFGLYLGPRPGLAFSVVAGAAAGVCWVATAFAINDMLEGRAFALAAIDGGYHAVRFTVIGLTFGLLG